MATYRILSLDGGGIRGLLSIVLLQRLEERVPGWLGRADLLAGTSTGGIIAIGLAAGVPLDELRQLYQAHCDEVFRDNVLDDIRDLGTLIGAEYGRKDLERLLRETLGDIRLHDLDRRVLVSAFDLDNEAPNPADRAWKAKFFHNFEGPDSDGDQLAYKVALYTSLAPTYFPTADGFIDGGVVANNPAVAALAQTQDLRAIIPLRPRLDEVVLFSLGTGQPARYIEGGSLDWGYAQWAPHLVTLMLEGGNDLASYQCRQLLDARFHRLSPPLGRDLEMDECAGIGELIRIALRADLSATEEWLRAVWGGEH
jgi:predicted acylesterase/phospholipase RssA